MVTHTGTVEWYNPAKGYGFITPDDQDLRVFVYWREIRAQGAKSLDVGERVEFQIYQGDHTPRATEVRPVGESA